MGVNKKGWYFTFDAIIFATIVLVSIQLSTQVATTVPQTTNNQFLSQDLLGVLSTQKVEDLDPTVYALFSSNITDDTFTVSEQLGQWWAFDQNVLVANFLNNYTDQIIREGVGIGFLVNSDALVYDSSPTQEQLASSKIIVSGVEKEKPIKGIVASARATKIKKNITQIYSMPPQGAGWDDGRAWIDKRFELPTNITISSATLVASVHTDRNINDRAFYVNNCLVPFVSGDFLYWSEGDVGVIDVTACVFPGNNTWNASLENEGYNAHIHPGTYLTIDYTADENLGTNIQTTRQSNRFYFDQVRSQSVSGSRSGAWASKPFYLPEEASNITINMYIRGESVRDYTNADCDVGRPSFYSCTWFSSWSGWRQARDYDYSIFMNSGTPFDTDGSPSLTAEYFYNTSQIGHRLINGTNIVTLYFNNYGDYVWGDGDTIISGLSYIELNYTLPVTTQQFGFVDVTQSVEFGGVPDNDKTGSFTFPPQTESILDATAFIVQRYSYEVDVWADPTNPPTTLVFSSPAARAVPSEVFIPEEQLERSSTVTNFVRVRDSGGGNHVLPISQILYSFTVPSQVGFGDVFDTQAEAEQDAIDRLVVKMGGFVDPTEITTNAESITNVPTLWGPAVIEVQTWQ